VVFFFPLKKKVFKTGHVTSSSKGTSDREQVDLKEVKNVFFLFSYMNTPGI